MTDSTQHPSRWQRIADALIFIDLGFPAEAVIEARDHWDEVRIGFLDELTRAVVNPARAIDEENALPLYAIYLAAEKRDSAFAPLMLDLLRLPVEQIDDLIGENALTEGMGRCLASVHHGDDAPFHSLAADERLNIYARLAAVDAVVVRAMEGDANADSVTDFIFRLAQGLAIRLRDVLQQNSDDLSEDDDELFHGFLRVLADLGAAQHWPAIEQWHRDELVDPYFYEIDRLRETIGAPLETRRAGMYKPFYVRDTVAEMSWWACFTEPDEPWPSNRYDDEQPLPYVRTQPKVGRNDPCPCGSGKKFKKCCGATV